MLCHTLPVHRPFTGRAGSSDPGRGLRAIPRGVEDAATAAEAARDLFRPRLAVVERPEETRREGLVFAVWRVDGLDFDFPPMPRTARAATLGSTSTRRAEEPGSW